MSIDQSRRLFEFFGNGVACSVDYNALSSVKEYIVADSDSSILAMSKILMMSSSSLLLN